ncbi:copper-translocating P-type ATPase [Rhizocola hellebori]|uniref:Copper-translocating P-type ATPase n=1 Tax=Rhizocola hellebori TaxID=1392758 RepID=A0A8J3VEN1_9ACTN|nr:cation-translocating P-type ATPase [Rhizocola hellebori]GIH03476.1 copper-translocating P-type ATPase [Rhizocola hellebori]
MSATATPVATEPSTAGLFGEADLSQERLLKRNLRFLVASAACMISGAIINLFIDRPPWTDVAVVIGVVGLTLGYPMFWIALKTLVSTEVKLRNKLNTEVFITIALVAVVYEGEYWYASWVVFILWVGETLMAWTGRHARSAVEALLKLVPRQARVAIPGDKTQLVPVEHVQIGQTVIVHPGERMPVDGVILTGATTIDESMLTGEAVPAERGIGEEVFAGTYNLQGAIQIRTAKTADQNTVARIVALMRKAQREHIPAKRTVDLFLLWFLPLVLLVAAVAGLLTGSLERVATILLVITPCAFAASTPLAIIATVGNAARRGIVVKGAASLEAASRASIVLLDKTGTLTSSTPALNAIDGFGYTDAEVLQLAAIAEKQSSHPLARAVVTTAEAQGMVVPDPDAFELAAGHGVKATFQQHSLVVGNERYLDQIGVTITGIVREIALRREAEGRTIAYLIRDGVIIGLLGFLAEPRREASEVIAGLKRLGVKQIVMITGDRDDPARAVAQQLGIAYRAQATPQAKLDQVQMRQREGHTVAMVGDGINDATALAAADVGIAMVTAGAEVSALAADVVVHGDNLNRVLAAMKLARRGISTIRLNILFATAYNIGGLILALFGLISPGTAVLFHAASFISVVLNSATVLRYNPKVPGSEPV